MHSRPALLLVVPSDCSTVQILGRYESPYNSYADRNYSLQAQLARLYIMRIAIKSLVEAYYVNAEICEAVTDTSAEA